MCILLYYVLINQYTEVGAGGTESLREKSYLIS